MYISDLERHAKRRKLHQQENRQPKRVPKSTVRKALENAILGIDKVMNNVDAIVEDYWTDEDGKPMAKGLPAKNFSNDAADQLYLAKMRLYRAIRMLDSHSGNSAR